MKNFFSWLLNSNNKKQISKRAQSHKQKNELQPNDVATTINYEKLSEMTAEKLATKMTYIIENQLSQKFVDAQIEAHFRIKDMEVQQAKIQHEEEQKQWEKDLKCVQYRGNKPVHKILNAITTPFRAWFGAITFNGKNASGDFGIYGFLRSFGVDSLRVYEIVFCLLSLACIYPIFKCVSIAPVFDLWLFVFGSLFALLIFIAAIIRIFRIKLDKCTDKNTIGVVVAFIAGIDAIVIGSLTSIVGNIVCLFIEKLIGGA